jgi:hypothetical protein
MKPLRKHDSPCFVEKVRAAVRIALPSQQPLEGFVSLAPTAEFHGGAETLLERFNSGDRVIPVQRNGEKDVLLLNPHDIESVSSMSRTAQDLMAPEPFRITHEERVRVIFMSGRQIEGVLRFALPDDLNRVSDYLNRDEDFFVLHTPGGTVLVNKRRVSTTRLYQQSPRPLQLVKDNAEAEPETPAGGEAGV